MSTSKRWGAWKAVAALAVAVGGMGCAGTVTHMPQASSSSIGAAQHAARTFDGSKERQIGRSTKDRMEAFDRVYTRVYPAAITICARMYASGCRESLATAETATVFTHGEGYDQVNAYADSEGKVYMTSGMLWASGNDDEIAMVMAHEIGHVLFQHPQKASRNQGGGMLLGAALGIALGAATYTPGMDTSYIGDLGEAGMQIGGGIGAVTFSPEMELEADRFAAFVVAEAGYDVEKAGNLIVRLDRKLSHETATYGKSFVSYFNTHPANDHRLAMWHEAARDIRRGQQAPLLEEARKAQVAAEKEAERRQATVGGPNSPYCVKLREKYPKCEWWKGENKDMSKLFSFVEFRCPTILWQNPERMDCDPTQ